MEGKDAFAKTKGGCMKLILLALMFTSFVSCAHSLNGQYGNASSPERSSGPARYEVGGLAR